MQPTPAPRSSLLACAAMLAIVAAPALALAATTKTKTKPQAPPEPPSIATPASSAAADSHAEAKAAEPMAAAIAIPDDLRELVRRYGNSRAADFFDVTTDGTKMLIGTRFGDSRQLHLIESVGGDRTQVSFTDDPIHAARFLPQDPNIVLYLQAPAGSENFQFYKLERDTGRIVRLSDGKTRIDDLLLARDGRRLSWSASNKSNAGTSVYVAESDTPTAPRRLTPHEGNWRPLDFSPNGRTLLVVHERSRGDAELFAVPVDGSGLKAAEPNMPGKKLWPPDGVSSMRSAAWSADGHDLFLVTDRFSDHQELVRIDPDHPEFPGKRITQSLDWDVDQLAASEDKGAPAAAAVTVVQDGYDRLYLLEPGTFQLMPVPLPPGVVTALRFPSVRADLLCIGLQSPLRPEDVYQLDVRSRRVVRWTNSEMGPIDPSQLLTPERVSWLSGELNIPALIYRPHNDNGAKLPVLLALHDGADGEGGPVAQGGSPPADDYSRPGFDPAAQLYANELGVAVLEPTIRGSMGMSKKFLIADPTARRDAQLKDLAATLDWIAAQPDLDPARVVILSDSRVLAESGAKNFTTRVRAALSLAPSAGSTERLGTPMLLERKHERDAALGATLLFLREKLLGYPVQAASSLH